MPPENPIDPDEWSDEELQATIHADYGVGADSGLPLELRFLVAAARIMRRRLQVSSLAADARPALFFLAPDGPDGTSAPLSPMLDNGITEIEGRYWFIGPQSGSGRSLPLADAQTDEDMFHYGIEVLGLGPVPAVCFETRTSPPVARYFPAGIANPNNYRPIGLTGAPITVDDAVDVVNLVWEQSMVTPTAQKGGTKLWKTPTKGYPVENAEARVQSVLRTALIVKFPTCIVRPEQSQATGRLDLELEEPSPSDPNSCIRHLLLELKVLRSYHSSGNPVPDSVNVAAVDEGVKQAASYGDERKVKARALFCFDMRTVFSGDTCFQPVNNRAKRKKVRLCVWHLFATPKAYRDWKESQGAPA